MKLYPSLLFPAAAKDRFDFDKGIIKELSTLMDDINSHPFKNLVAVIYHNIKRNGYLSNIPKGLLERLKSEYLSAIALDMRQRGWLENFIKNKLPEDIEIILLKGSANWGTIYSPEAPRTGCDIDILVRERDFERVVGILEKEAKKTILDESRVFTNQNAYEYAYIVEDYSISVEIHRRISYPFVGDVDYERLFKSSKRHPFYRDRRVRILSSEERLINTMIHSLKHADITAHELVDAYRIIKRYRTDLKDIIGTAIKYKISDYSILFLRHLFRLIEGNPDLISYSEGGLKTAFAIKNNIFELLYLSNAQINFRVRQLLALMLLDDPIDILQFLSFYINLRAKDLFYNYLGRLSGRRYA
ncbi:MAG: nucleotidyltransferase family protein [Myxococcota bacterium]